MSEWVQQLSLLFSGRHDTTLSFISVITYPPESIDLLALYYLLNESLSWYTAIYLLLSGRDEPTVVWVGSSELPRIESLKPEPLAGTT